MSTVYSWSSSADGTWTTTVGTAPSVAVGGTYGERWVWPATTVQSFTSRTGFTLDNHGIRIVYSVASFNSANVSHMILMGLNAGTMQWKLNITATGFLRILDAASTNVAQSTVALSAGTEYRIECYRVGATLTAKAYTLAGTLVTSISGTVASTQITTIQFGNNAALSAGTLGSFTMDEIRVTDVGAEVGPVTPTAVTYYEWSSSAQAWNTTTGAAPSVTAGGSYGERIVWPSTTAQAWIGATIPSAGDFGCRFIYSVSSFDTGAHSIAQGQSSGVQAFRVDISAARVIVIRPVASTPVVSGSVALSASTEYRIEIQRSGASLTVKVYSGTGNTLIDTVTHTAVGTDPVTRMVFGNNTTLTGTLGSFSVDEVVVNDQPVDVGPATPTAASVSAPADFSVEPWEPFTLTATSTAPSCTWSQVSGATAAPVNGTGLTATVAKAPPDLAGASLVYRASVTGGSDDVTVTVLPATDAVWSGTAWVPVRLVSGADSISAPATGPGLVTFNAAYSGGYASDPVLQVAPGSVTGAIDANAAPGDWLSVVVSSASAATLSVDAAKGGAGDYRTVTLKSSADGYVASLGRVVLSAVRPTFQRISFQIPGSATYRLYVTSPFTTSTIEFDNFTLSGPASPTSYPTSEVAVYKLMWPGDGPSLASIPAGVNVVRMAFANGGPPIGLVGFGADGETTFKAQAAMMRAAGVRFVVSVGGSGYPVSTTDRTGFLAAIAAIRSQLGFLDGIDWDIEGSTLNQADVVYISQQLKAVYGSNFAITFAPNGSNISTYLPVAVACQAAGALDSFGQQFYDAPVTQAAAAGRIQEAITAGIPPAKYAVGMMVGSTANYWTNSQCQANMQYFHDTYGVTRAYLWEANRTGTAQWVTDMTAIVGVSSQAVPLVADAASDFRRRIGFCANMGESPYVDDPTVAMNTMLDYISPVAGSGIGVLRIGRTSTSGTQQTAQRAAAAIAAARGIKLLTMPDDYGTPTPAERLTEALTNWSSAQVLAWGQPNEWNGTYSLATWPDAGVNASTSTATQGSKEELLRQMSLILAARDASAQPTIPIMSPSMASKSVYGWYQALQTYALSIGKDVSALSEWIELHDYPGGWEPSNSNGTRATREAAEAAFGVGRTTLLTETGYHNCLTTAPTNHKPATELASATYYGRLWFENLYDNGYEYVTAFQLANTPSKTEDFEKEFGIFWGATASGHTIYDPKPAATAVRNLLTLYADTSTTWTPQPLIAAVTADAGVSWKLHQRSDGKWLLAVWQPAARVWDPSTLTTVTPSTKNLTVSVPVARTFARHVPRTSGTAEATATGTSAAVAVGADLVVLLIT